MATTMVLFSKVGEHIPVFRKQKGLHADTESLVSRMSYRGTSLLILSMVVLVTCPDWISGKEGKLIDCMHGDSIPDAVINNYCYIQGTFLVPRHDTDRDTTHGRDNSQTGVGPYDPLSDDPEDDIKVKAYYQWVPFVLLFQCLMFYVPHLIYKAVEGGKVRNVLGSLNLFVLDKEKRHHAEDELAKWFVETLGIHDLWGTGIILAQTLYLVNVVGQIFFTDMFLGYEFSTYGVHAYTFLEKGDKDRVDPMARVFPRVTKCTFHKYGPTGTIQRHDAQCILPINIINEKIYVFLWFWFILLAVLTGLDLILRVGQAFIPSVRRMVLSKKMRTVPRFKAEQLRPNIDLGLITRSLEHGDWQLMYAIVKNLDAITYAEWLVAVTGHLRDREENKPGRPDAQPLLPAMERMLNVT